MTVTVDRVRAVPLHPLHAILLAGALPLFLGTLLSDWAYGASYEVQWTNFAAWLLVGALVFSGLALLWSLIDLIRADRPAGRGLRTAGLLLATWVLGFIDALVHAKDAWAMMPEGLILSVIAAVLAIAAAWSGFSADRSGVGR